MATTIIGVSLTNRSDTAVDFQKILTENGCNIRTRLGLHPSPHDVCLNRGIVLLEVVDGADDLIAELKKHWEVQTMHF
jgi:hypothetical protein